MKPSSVKQNFGLVSLNGLRVLHDISYFEYYGSQILVLVEKEFSQPAEKTSNFKNKPPTGNTNHCAIHTK